MQIELSPEETQALRRVGARINGALGGKARTMKKAKASARNIKRYWKAQKTAAA